MTFGKLAMNIQVELSESCMLWFNFQLIKIKCSYESPFSYNPYFINPKIDQFSNNEL